MAAGYMTYTTGVASTVGGSFSTVTTADATTDAEKENVKYQGTESVSYGTYNLNLNTDATKKASAGVNSLVGQTNLAKIPMRPKSTGRQTLSPIPTIVSIWMK